MAKKKITLESIATQIHKMDEQMTKGDTNPTITGVCMLIHLVCASLVNKEGI